MFVCLFSNEQALLDTAIFEPLEYGPGAESDAVPLPNGTAPTSHYGLLVDELRGSPESVFRPLLRLGEEALDLNRIDPTRRPRPTFLLLALYFVRLAHRVCRFAQRVVDVKEMAGSAGGVARAAPLLAETRTMLVTRVAPLLSRWLVIKRAATDSAENRNMMVILHSHRALLYSTDLANPSSVPQFLNSAAHVVQWHDQVDPYMVQIAVDSRSMNEALALDKAVSSRRSFTYRDITSCASCSQCDSPPLIYLNVKGARRERRGGGGVASRYAADAAR